MSAEFLPSHSGHVAVFAPAKINLYLHIIGKRPDGFHLLDSLIAFANIGDIISVAPDETLSLTIDGPFAAHLKTENDNLVLKAANLLAEISGIQATGNITLTKNLPIASGIGGGSADAAATLHALNKLWDPTIPMPQLHNLAEKLGADVPICLNGDTSFITGIGEKITPAPKLPETWIVLANPNLAVSTPEVFAKRESVFSQKMPFTTTPKSVQKFAHELAKHSNDLTSPALETEPRIKAVLSALSETDGQLLTRLSGSGATCFALYADEIGANAAAKSLASNHPDWWIQPTSLRQ